MNPVSPIFALTATGHLPVAKPIFPVKGIYIIQEEKL
jgi:hypothetical protein